MRVADSQERSEKEPVLWPLSTWAVALVFLALTWLVPDLRGMALAFVGLNVAVALVIGVSVVVGRRARMLRLALVLVLCWLIAVVWQYARRFEHDMDWPIAVVAGLGLAICPTIVAAMFDVGKDGKPWSRIVAGIQAATLVFAAAPPSNLLAYMLVVLLMSDRL